MDGSSGSCSRAHERHDGPARGESLPAPPENKVATICAMRLPRLEAHVVDVRHDVCHWFSELFRVKKRTGIGHPRKKDVRPS